MATPELKRVGGFDLLSQSARDRLRARVTEADGDIDSIKEEIRAKLDDHDNSTAAANGGQHLTQAERAFYVAQMDYLEALRKAQEPDDEPQKGGFFERFKGAFRGTGAST